MRKMLDLAMKFARLKAAKGWKMLQRILAIAALSILGLQVGAGAEETGQTCPDNALQYSAQAYTNILQGTVQGSIDVVTASQLADQCPEDQYTLALVAAILTSATNYTEDANTKAQLFIRAWDVLNAYGELPYPSSRTLVVINANSQRVPLPLSNQFARDVRKGLVPVMHTYSAAVGAVHADFKTDAVFDRCDTFASTDTSETERWLATAENQDLAFAFLQNRAEACRGEDALIDRLPLKYLAGGKLIRAEQEQDALKRLDFVLSAEQDVIDFKKDQENQIVWRERDQEKLDMALTAARDAALPVLTMQRFAIWFEPDTIGTTQAVATISTSLNEVWAVPEGETVEASFPKRMQAFGQRVGYLATYAEEQGVKAEGWAMLFEAVTAFNNGTYRNDATRDLPNPPEYLYTWLDLKAAE